MGPSCPHGAGHKVPPKLLLPPGVGARRSNPGWVCAGAPPLSTGLGGHRSRSQVPALSWDVKSDPRPEHWHKTHSKSQESGQKQARQRHPGHRRLSSQDPRTSPDLRHRCMLLPGTGPGSPVGNSQGACTTYGQERRTLQATGLSRHALRCRGQERGAPQATNSASLDHFPPHGRGSLLRPAEDILDTHRSPGVRV